MLIRFAMILLCLFLIGCVSTIPDAQRQKLVDLNLSLAYYSAKKHQFKKADVYYKNALALAPDSARVLNDYANYLCERGDVSKASHYFDLALQDENYVHHDWVLNNQKHCSFLYKKGKTT